MSITAYFTKRPKAEILADAVMTSAGESEPKETLTALEAARFFQRQREARLTRGQTLWAEEARLDPVLRHHLRIDE